MDITYAPINNVGLNPYFCSLGGNLKAWKMRYYKESTDDQAEDTAARSVILEHLLSMKIPHRNKYYTVQHLRLVFLHGVFGRKKTLKNEGFCRRHFKYRRWYCTSLYILTSKRLQASFPEYVDPQISSSCRISQQKTECNSQLSCLFLHYLNMMPVYRINHRMKKSAQPDVT